MMKGFIGWKERHPKLTSALLWLLSTVVTLAFFTYQDKTGPTYPLEGTIHTSAGAVKFEFLRSETIGNDLSIMLLDPVPEGVSGYVKYRRYKSNDKWKTVPLERQTFEFSRHGHTERVSGVGVRLPSLHERAGKYEYFVYLRIDEGKPFSVTGDKPVYARYKARVPIAVIAVHVLIIFLAMLLAMRTLFEAALDGDYKKLAWATLVTFSLGAFVFGPWVQWYAFGVWWSGIPLGYDWTDNKVLLELAAWIWVVVANRGNRRDRLSVYIAGAVTLLVYFIPHSLFGSEYNYKTGTGRGTAG